MFNTHITFFAKETKKINHCGRTILSLTGDILAPQYPTQPVNRWSHNFSTCNGCKKNHEIIANKAYQHFITFPNCCTEHKKLSEESWFNIEDYQNAPLLFADKLFYTWFHILEFIDSEEWEIEIFDYLDYTIKSFGSLPVSYCSPFFLIDYLEQVKVLLSDQELTSDLIEKEIIDFRINTIISFIDGYIKGISRETQKSDFDEVIKTYQKWLEIFPFEISFFADLKPYFENKVPILNGKLETNKYSGIARGKMHTKSSLINALLNLTNNLLTKINSLSLHEKGLLTEPQKIKLELVVNERKMKLQQGYVNNSNNEEQQYRKILKEWFVDEKQFIDQITLLVKPLPPQQKKTKADILKENLTQYGFFELEKVKTLSEQSRALLIKKISESGLPYAIAMLDYLQFLPHLLSNYFDSKYKLYREVSKWFDSDSDGRSVKGNLGSLLNKTGENRNRYTAYKHKENVISDYEQLK